MGGTCLVIEWPVVLYSPGEPKFLSGHVSPAGNLNIYNEEGKESSACPIISSDDGGMMMRKKSEGRNPIGRIALKGALSDVKNIYMHTPFSPFFFSRSNFSFFFFPLSSILRLFVRLFTHHHFFPYLLSVLSIFILLPFFNFLQFSFVLSLWFVVLVNPGFIFLFFFFLFL